MSLPLPKKVVADMAHASRYKPEPTPVDKLFDDSIERAMFDEILGPSRSARPASRSARSEDHDFNLAITKRLAAAEQEIAVMRKQYMRLQEHADTMQAENVELRRQLKDQDKLEQDMSLLNDNRRMAEQIRDMEKVI